jgi:hypothetical protein
VWRAWSHIVRILDHLISGTQLRQPRMVDEFSRISSNLSAQFIKEVGSMPGGSDGTGRGHEDGQPPAQHFIHCTRSCPVKLKPVLVFEAVFCVLRRGGGGQRSRSKHTIGIFVCLDGE